MKKIPNSRTHDLIYRQIKSICPPGAVHCVRYKGEIMNISIYVHGSTGQIFTRDNFDRALWYAQQWHGDNKQLNLF